MPPFQINCGAAARPLAWLSLCPLESLYSIPINWARFNRIN
jgi:hypothetical protein